MFFAFFPEYVQAKNNDNMFCADALGVTVTVRRVKYSTNVSAKIRR